MKTTVFSTSLAACCAALLIPASALADAAEDKLDRLDADNNGRVSRAEFISKGERIFAKIDKNADGRLTLTELRSAADKREEKEDNKSVRKGWGRYERDDDEDVSPGERLKNLDTNGDDVVTMAEFTSMRKDKFKRIDKNDDGSLTELELD